MSLYGIVLRLEVHHGSKLHHSQLSQNFRQDPLGELLWETDLMAPISGHNRVVLEQKKGSEKKVEIESRNFLLFYHIRAYFIVQETYRYFTL